MFDRRLKTFLALLGLGFAVVAVRLIQLQVFCADEYRRQAERALIKPDKFLPFVRGRILDRHGAVLACDEPTWDLCVPYGILVMDEAYLHATADRLQRAHVIPPALDAAEALRILRTQIDQMWRELADFSQTSPAELQERRQRRCRRIQRIKDIVERARGFEVTILEERISHPMVTALDDQQQIQARIRFAKYPWVEVADSNRRVYHDAVSIAHIIGRMGSIDAMVMRDDPRKDDPLACYLAGETVGIAGVEWSAEQTLRGRRGKLRHNHDGQVIERIEPENGRDVYLTLDIDLQRDLYGLLGEAILNLDESSGGCIVVLDVDTRQILTMVSYPAFDPNRFNADYDRLVRDTRWMPLRFRAVANRYAPGSIVKPLTYIAGLSSGKIDMSSTHTCEGALFPHLPDRWRCWRSSVTHQPKHHGTLTGEDAIKHSCNVFFYDLGSKLGAEYLCNWFDMVGFGRVSGTGLKEENAGVLPTPAWLEQHRGRAVTTGDARNFAIGQGEVCITPVQAVNYVAVVAGGVYEPVRLILSDPDEQPRWPLPVEAGHWASARMGMFRVVNETGGTANLTAHLDDPDFVLFGKTGSAEASPWPLSFGIDYIDEHGRRCYTRINANTKSSARATFLSQFSKGQEPKLSDDDLHVDRWFPAPPESDRQRDSHAWFAGYLQRKDARGRPSPNYDPEAAIVVMVEFGGSGGRVSGPIAKDAAHVVADWIRRDHGRVLAADVR